MENMMTVEERYEIYQLALKEANLHAEAAVDACLDELVLCPSCDTAMAPKIWCDEVCHVCEVGSFEDFQV